MLVCRSVIHAWCRLGIQRAVAARAAAVGQCRPHAERGNSGSTAAWTLYRGRICIWCRFRSETLRECGVRGAWRLAAQRSCVTTSVEARGSACGFGECRSSDGRRAGGEHGVRVHTFPGIALTVYACPPQIELPNWADVVKTGVYKELAPYDPDWYFVRCASIARKLYLKGGIGVGKFKKIYGALFNAAAVGWFLGAVRREVQGFSGACYEITL